MKFLAPLLLVFVLCPVLAQPGQGRYHGDPGRHMNRDYGRPLPQDYGRPMGPYSPYGRSMPPAERRLSWEDRQRLREQVRNGNMTRDEAREHWREQRERRGFEPGRSPEERQRLRRDVQDWNRDYDRR